MAKIVKQIKNQAVPRGPQIDDEAHERIFSEIGPPETVTVIGRKTVLFDFKDEPLTRKIGF